MGVGLFVGVWLARYLGPEQFGLFNYALAFVALFGAVASLGLNSIVVRDLVQKPEDAGVTLGTAFVLQLLGAIVAVVLIVGCIAWLRPEDELTKLMIAILGFSLVFKSSEVVKYWFEAQVQSRYVVWIESAAVLLLAIAKVAMILAGAPLIAFVWTVLLEAALVAFGLFGIYLKIENRRRGWSIKVQHAKKLLNDAWPLMLSGIAVMVYMRIDQLMLGEMVGNDAVGIYSAALRISEVWYMIPLIITTSLFPSIINIKKENPALYRLRLQKLLDLMTVLSITIAVIITLLADWLVSLLYGGAYEGAATVLKIHVWTCVFVFMGVAGGRWYLAENLQNFILPRTLVGGGVNILLNLVFIPKYGPAGAAVTTLFSQFLSGYMLDLLSPRTRFVFYLKSKSFVNVFLLRLSFSKIL